MSHHEHDCWVWQPAMPSPRWWPASWLWLWRCVDCRKIDLSAGES